MKATTGFSRNTIVDGVLFLLLLGIMVFAFGELFEIAETFADKIQEIVLPSAGLPLVPVLIVTGLLVSGAFAAGWFASTRLGQGMLSRAERIGGSWVPRH